MTREDAPICWVVSCTRPATEELFHGVTKDGTEVVVLVCPRHAPWRPEQDYPR